MNTIAEAFEAIDQCHEGIPFDAIEFLYNHPQDEAIQQKIMFALANAYDEDIYYDPEEDHYLSTPLWYAIVAENHLTEALIDPVIHLFTTTEDDWDFMNEQGAYLVGALAEKFPDTMAEKAFRVIEEQVAKNAETPYLFLIDFMYFIDVEKYKPRLLQLLKDPNFYWIDAFVMRFADLQIKEAVPIIQKLLKRKNLDRFSRIELEAALETLEKGQAELPEYAQPYVKQRGPWKEHYQAFEKRFYNDDETEEKPLDKELRELREMQQLLEMEAHPYQRQLPKIGRNEKVNVRYTDGKVVNNIKFKKVEDDLLNERCELI